MEDQKGNTCIKRSSSFMKKFNMKKEDILRRTNKLPSKTGKFVTSNIKLPHNKYSINT